MKKLLAIIIATFVLVSLAGVSPAQAKGPKVKSVCDVVETGREDPGTLHLDITFQKGNKCPVWLIWMKCWDTASRDNEFVFDDTIFNYESAGTFAVTTTCPATHPWLDDQPAETADPNGDGWHAQVRCWSRGCYN